MLTIAIFLAYFALAFFLHSLGLYLVLRRLPSRFSRALLATLLLAAANIGIDIAFAFLSLPKESAWIVSIPVLLFAILANILIIMSFYRIKFVRALLSWLSAQLGSALVIALGLFILRPYVVEAFRLYNAAMMPTLNPEYQTQTCPLCGGTLIFPLPYPGMHMSPYIHFSAICQDCLHISQVDTSKVSPASYPGDRFIAAKFLTPKRWDILIYNHAPDAVYCQRVIALPGENVYIDSGKIFINGVPIAPPPEISKLQYKSLPPFANHKMLATSDAPVTLGPDEYFAVGDSAELSLDSRTYGPVKKSAIIGVVTLIYWPPSRFHIFR